MAALLEDGRLLGGVVEPLGAGRMAFLGLGGLVRPRVAAQAAATTPVLFREWLLQQTLEGHDVFLRGGGLARANAKGDLAVVHLFGCPDEIDPSSPGGSEVHRIAYEAFAFLHGGYRLAEFWQETILPEATLMLTSSGVSEVRPARALMPAGEARLFRFTRADAEAQPGHPLAYLMKYPPAQFGLTRSQQNLLELALLDWSDREVAMALDLTEDGVKKRWRSIYSRVEERAPALLDAARPGSDRRRTLLAYLRVHLEELRPCSPAPSKATPTV